MASQPARPEAGMPGREDGSAGGGGDRTGIPLRPLLSVVIPALNEAVNLRRLLPKVFAIEDELGGPVEVVVVDSDSEDDTLEAVRELSAHGTVRLVNEPTRGDLSRAWRRGFCAARGELLACMDADGCHDPRDLIAMARKIRGGCALVVGRREAAGFARMPGKRPVFEILARVGNQLSGLIYGSDRISDASHGFRMMRRETWVTIGPRLRCAGNTAMVEIVGRASLAGLPLGEVSTVYGKRIEGEDRLTLRRELPRHARCLLSLAMSRLLDRGDR